MSGNIYNALATTNLSDGRLQLWASDSNTDIITFWKKTSDPNSGWTPASPFETPEAKAFTFTVGSLNDGRLQFFVVDGSFQLWSTQKQTSDANAHWTPLSPIDTGQIRAYSISSGRLSDGRLQLFIVDTSNQIWTTWQRTMNASDRWSPLSPFQTTQTGSRFITVGRLSDGRLQLFVVDNSNQIWTTWQQTSDPNAEWTSLSLFEAPPTGASILAAGSLSDGRMQFFIIELDNSHIWTTWKQTTDPNAPWAPLSPFPTPPEIHAEWLAAGSLSDGRLQFFVANGSGEGPIWTTWKQTTDPNSAWMPFSKLS
jgi:hypothetical protein